MSGQTISDFFQAVLQGIGAPVTQSNLEALAGVAHMEGANNRYNPLNSVVPYGNSTSFNSVGVQDYHSFQNGVQGTIALLNGSVWSGVVSALKADQGVPSVAQQFANVYQGWDPGTQASAFMGGDMSQILTQPAGSPSAYTGGAATAGAYSAANSQGLSAGGTPLSAAQYEQSLGALSGIITQVPELNNLLANAIKTQQPAADFVNAVQNSVWYRSHSDSWRQIFALQFSDPAEYRQQLSNQANDIITQARQMGVLINGSQANALAHDALVGAWSQQQLQAHIGNLYLQDQARGRATGQAAQLQQQMFQMASQYGVPVTTQQVQNFTSQILTGQETMDGFKQQMEQNAMSLFPGLKQQIQNGQTVQDVAQPYVATMAQTLELDPNSLTLQDPTIKRALQYTTPGPGQSAGGITPGSLTQPQASGTTTPTQPKQPTSTTPSTSTPDPGLMPLYTFENSLRQDPRWDQTNNAKQEAYGMLHQLGQYMGFAS